MTVCFLSWPHCFLWENGQYSSKSPDGEKDQNHISQSAAEIRDVFGDSDDEEEAGYAVRNEIEQDSHVSTE